MNKRFDLLKKRFQATLASQRKVISAQDAAFMASDKKNARTDKLVGIAIVMLLFAGFVFWILWSKTAAFVVLGVTVVITIGWLIWFTKRYVGFLMRSGKESRK